MEPVSLRGETAFHYGKSLIHSGIKTTTHGIFRVSIAVKRPLNQRPLETRPNLQLRYIAQVSSLGVTDLVL